MDIFRHIMTVTGLSLLITCVVVLALDDCDCDKTGCPTNLQHTTEIFRRHDYCYQFVHEEMYWPDARQFCQVQGGSLVRIDNANFNRWIISKLNSLWWRNKGVWIGLHDQENDRDWLWVTNKTDVEVPLSWSNWGAGHPGAWLHQFRDCARMVRDDKWKWHETPCLGWEWHYRFICEYYSPAPKSHGAHGQMGDIVQTTTEATTTTDVIAGILIPKQTDVDSAHQSHEADEKEENELIDYYDIQKEHIVPLARAAASHTGAEDGRPTGALIVGGAAGAALLLLLLVLLLLVWRRRQSHKSAGSMQLSQVLFSEESFNDSDDDKTDKKCNSSKKNLSASGVRIIDNPQQSHQMNIYVDAPQHMSKKCESANHYTDVDSAEGRIEVVEREKDEEGRERVVVAMRPTASHQRMSNMYVAPDPSAGESCGLPEEGSACPLPPALPAPRDISQQYLSTVPFPASNEGYLPMDGRRKGMGSKAVQYDTPRPQHVYSEIAERPYSTNLTENIYESLEDVRGRQGKYTA